MPKIEDPPKRERFVTEYLVDLNATQAAIRAGYSEASARQIASDLLSKHDIQEAVAKAMADREARTQITQDKVLRELAALGMSDIRHYSFGDDGTVTLAIDAPDHAMRAVSSIKRKVRVDEDGNTTIDTELRLWDKPATLRMIGQHLGMFDGTGGDAEVESGEYVVTVKRREPA
jgi:phage terminase small subunit